MGAKPPSLGPAHLVPHAPGHTEPFRYNPSTPQSPARFWSPTTRISTLHVLYALIVLGGWALARQRGALAGLAAGSSAFLILLTARHALLPRFANYSALRVAGAILLVATTALHLVPLSLQPVAYFSGSLTRLGEPSTAAYDAAGLFGLAVLCSVMVASTVLHRRELAHPSANLDLDLRLSTSRDFRAGLARYIEALTKELDRYDRTVNWSDRDFTPLEAEIEADELSTTTQRVTRDLVGAIRKDGHSAVFVVLGDPGSGKSVSLRRLVRGLCAQAKASGVVPIYVNLREFPVGPEPTTASLVQFMKDMAFRQTGRDGRAFLDNWYEAFRVSGRLFFVIDSFDELPSILDCDEHSAVHQRVSTTFDRLFTQEFQGCRSVLASRHFRAPSDVRGTRLLVRPFTERQIRRAMRTWLLGQGIDAQRYVRRLFLERPSLVPAIRNPFTAELIADYAMSANGDTLPSSLFAVFDQYLLRRLEKDQPEFARLGVLPSQVRAAAGLIAYAMYEKADVGLETTVDAAVDVLLPRYGARARPLVQALQYARLVRIGGQQSTFSFVHRRFAEFFVVDAIRDGDDNLALESIPADSRWRDCLVMYCGIADLPVRVSVSTYCWTIVQRVEQTLSEGRLGADARPGIHCMRFLADGFRNTPDSLAPFTNELGPFVVRLLQNPQVLVAKLGAELIPLLDRNFQQQAVHSAFAGVSPWVRDTAFGACRHLAHLDDTSLSAIQGHFRSLPFRQLLANLSDFDFGLSLSDAFRPIRRALWMDVGEGLATRILAVSSIAAAVVFNQVAAAVSLTMAGGAVVAVLLDDLTEPATLSAIVRRGGSYSDVFRRVLAVFAGPVFFTIIWPTNIAPLELIASGHVTTVAASFAPGMALLIGWQQLADAPRALLRSLRSLLSWRVLLAPLVWGAFAVTLASVSSVVVRVLAWAPMLIAGILGAGMLWLVALALREILRGCVSVVRDTWRFLGDRRRLKTLGIPRQMAGAELYDTLETLGSSRGRQEYVRAVRTNRVRVVGAVPQPPTHFLRDSLLADELAKLHELWHGLAT